MRIWREGVRAALGAALVLAVVVGTASAHSILQRSIPSANASLSTPPRQVVLVFSEPVVAGLSTATVIDRQGVVVSQAVAVVGDGRALAISVGPLATGVYTARWRVLSATDGHTTSGFLLFGVGERSPGLTNPRAVGELCRGHVARGNGLLRVPHPTPPAPTP